MSTIHIHESHPHFQANRREHRSGLRPLPGHRSAAEVKEMLRDIAFVLRMTQRVREEMEAEQEPTALAFEPRQPRTPAIPVSV